MTWGGSKKKNNNNNHELQNHNETNIIQRYNTYVDADAADGISRAVIFGTFSRTGMTGSMKFYCLQNVWL